MSYISSSRVASALVGCSGGRARQTRAPAGCTSLHWRSNTGLGLSSVAELHTSMCTGGALPYLSRTPPVLLHFPTESVNIGGASC